MGVSSRAPGWDLKVLFCESADMLICAGAEVWKQGTYVECCGD